MAHLLGHMQVMSLEWMPFYILYLLRATQRQRTGKPWLRDSLLAGLFLVLVGLCDWYFVLYLFLFTGLFLILDIGYWYWVNAPISFYAIRDTQYRPSLLPRFLVSFLFCCSPQSSFQ